MIGKIIGVAAVFVAQQLGTASGEALWHMVKGNVINDTQNKEYKMRRRIEREEKRKQKKAA